MIRSDCSGMVVLRRVLVAVVFAACALGFLSPAARADGDPASDVLIYQNLFVATDANMPTGQQVELGNLLTSAANSGFPVRVAIIAQPDDLGAITALWDRPTAYASFLGIELSLAYTGRLLVVMPDGFGFYWHGHPTTAAYHVLAGQHIDVGGDGLATTAEDAVRALAAASGVRLTAPSAPGAVAVPAGNPAVHTASWNVPGIVVVIVLFDLAIGAAGVLLALRAGVRIRLTMGRRSSRSHRTAS
jgi:hypothetical protein